MSTKYPFEKIVDNLPKVDDEEILFYLKLIEEQAVIYHRKEIQKLEKEKARAIITDLNQFKALNEDYKKLRSQSPQIWVKEWKFYNMLSEELTRRKSSMKTG